MVGLNTIKLRCQFLMMVNKHRAIAASYHKNKVELIFCTMKLYEDVIQIADKSRCVESILKLSPISVLLMYTYCVVESLL